MRFREVGDWAVLGFQKAVGGENREGESVRDLYQELREKLTERFDKDGDGELSRDERRSMFDQARREYEVERNKEYDTNGDGELSEAERDAMRKQWQQRAQEWRERAQRRRDLEQWDKDEDGILNDSEKAAKEAAEKAEKERLEKANAEVIAKYDTNKDGVLDNKEVEAMQKAIAEMTAHLSAVEGLADTWREEKPTLLREVESTIRRYKSSRRGWNGRGGFGDRGGDRADRGNRGRDRGGRSGPRGGAGAPGDPARD